VPGLASQAERPFLRVLRSGKLVLGIAFEGMTTAQPGVHRFWRENVYPIILESGMVTGINVSVEEITEEKRLSEALRESALRERMRAIELEAVMNATPAAIFISHDRLCSNVTGNAEAVRLLRLRPGENPSVSAPGARPFTVYANDHPVPADQLPLQRAAATGKEVRGVELAVHFKNGDVIHTQVNAAPLRNEAGKVCGAVAAFVDVTGQKQVAEILRQESQCKDEFLASLANEQRTSLASIQTTAELMKLTPGRRPQWRVIVKSWRSIFAISRA